MRTAQSAGIIFLCGAIFGTVVGGGPVPAPIVALAFAGALVRFLMAWYDARQEGGK